MYSGPAASGHYERMAGTIIASASGKTVHVRHQRDGRLPQGDAGLLDQRAGNAQRLIGFERQRELAARAEHRSPRLVLEGRDPHAEQPHRPRAARRRAAAPARPRATLAGVGERVDRARPRDGRPVVEAHLDAIVRPRRVLRAAAARRARRPAAERLLELAGVGDVASEGRLARARLRDPERLDRRSRRGSARARCSSRPQALAEALARAASVGAACRSPSVCEAQRREPLGGLRADALAAGAPARRRSARTPARGVSATNAARLERRRWRSWRPAARARCRPTASCRCARGPRRRARAAPRAAVACSERSR